MKTILRDRFDRTIDYLRISVTDRCNLRCRYCVSEGVRPFTHRRHDDIIRFEEIVLIVRAAARLGIHSIRITGGEPLARRDIAELCRSISIIDGIDDLSLSTNGVFLADKASSLRDAGVGRINISFDSMIPDTLRELTGFDKPATIVRGIDAAIEAGFAPIKLNTVVMRGINDKEIRSFIEFAASRGLILRFIEAMPIGGLEFIQGKRIPTPELIETIGRDFTLIPRIDSTVTGSGPARYYEVADLGSTIGFISAMSHSFCGVCNRLRVTSTKDIRTCLALGGKVRLGDIFKLGCTEEEQIALLGERLIEAANAKPEGHRWAGLEREVTTTNMCSIGG